MFELLTMTNNELVAFQVKGKLHQTDYEKLQAMLKKAEQDYGKVKIYIEIVSLEGMEPAAMWEDVKTYFSHAGKIDKAAVVGDNKIEKSLTKFTEPFVSGEVKFFDEKNKDLAKQWIKR